MKKRAYIHFAIIAAVVAVSGVAAAQLKIKKTLTSGTRITADGVYRLVKTWKVADVVAATCPSGTTLLGGGCQGVGGDALITGAPQGNTWICQFAPRKTPLKKTAYAICGPRPGGYQAVASAREANLAWANCPSGKTLIGGGCNTVGTGGLIASRPVGNTWTCQGKPQPTPLRKEAEAICADRPTGYQTVTATKTADVVSVTCPAGKKLVSGGCHGVGGDAIVVSMPQNDTWLCTFKPRTTPLAKTASAVCVSR
jgi:hypothetical protein